MSNDPASHDAPIAALLELRHTKNLAEMSDDEIRQLHDRIKPLLQPLTLKANLNDEAKANKTSKRQQRQSAIQAALDAI